MPPHMHWSAGPLRMGSLLLRMLPLNLVGHRHLWPVVGQPDMLLDQRLPMLPLLLLEGRLGWALTPVACWEHAQLGKDTSWLCCAVGVAQHH